MTHDVDRFRYRAGIGAASSYQVSGRPWMTGSGPDGLAAQEEVKIEFPSVTKSVTVINVDADSNDLLVHFNSTSSGDVIAGNHYIALRTDRDGFTFDVKCKEIYISNPETTATPGLSGSSYEVYAELTGIDIVDMFPLTGSGLTE